MNCPICARQRVKRFFKLLAEVLATVILAAVFILVLVTHKAHAQDDPRPRERIALFHVENPPTEAAWIEAWDRLNRFSETMRDMYGLRPREFLFKQPGENGVDSYFIGWVYRP